MRVVALIFGLLGAAGSGYLGFRWFKDADANKGAMQMARKMNEVVKDPATAEAIAHYDRLVYASYALLGGAALGAIGSVLVLNKKGMFAALLFLIGFATPLALAQDGKPVIFTFGLALGGLFSLFVRSGTPYRVPLRDADILEDDDMV